jgi:Tfp pilus assembly protein PilP
MKTMLITLAFSVALAAQTPTSSVPANASAPPPPPPISSDAPMPPPSYAYSHDGRRDPFVSLFNRGATETRAGAAGQKRPEGIGGVMVEEVVVKGILQTRGAWVAMVGAPNGKTYTVRAGDRLMDGSVRTINAQSVVMLQEVNDPLSLEKQREVRKYLRGEVK